MKILKHCDNGTLVVQKHKDVKLEVHDDGGMTMTYFPGNLILCIELDEEERIAVASALGFCPHQDRSDCGDCFEQASAKGAKEDGR